MLTGCYSVNLDQLETGRLKEEQNETLRATQLIEMEILYITASVRATITSAYLSLRPHKANAPRSNRGHFGLYIKQMFGWNKFIGDMATLG